MKKSSKPVIVIIILFFVLVTIILLSAQGLKFKCEELIRERTRLDVEIKSQRIERVNLVAKYQMLTAETIIRHYAATELMLAEGEVAAAKKILIEKDLVNEVNKKLKDRYE